MDLSRFEIQTVEVREGMYYDPFLETTKIILPPLEAEPGQFKAQFVKEMHYNFYPDEDEWGCTYQVYETDDRQLAEEAMRYFRPPATVRDQQPHTYAIRFKRWADEVLPTHPSRGFEPEQYRPHERKWLGAQVLFDKQGESYSDGSNPNPDKHTYLHNSDIPGWVVSLSPQQASVWIRVPEEEMYYNVSLNDPSLKKVGPALREHLDLLKELS